MAVFFAVEVLHDHDLVLHSLVISVCVTLSLTLSFQMYKTCYIAN